MIAMTPIATTTSTLRTIRTLRTLTDAPRGQGSSVRRDGRGHVSDAGRTLGPLLGGVGPDRQPRVLEGRVDREQAAVVDLAAPVGHATRRGTVSLLAAPVVLRPV